MRDLMRSGLWSRAIVAAGLVGIAACDATGWLTVPEVQQQQALQGQRVRVRGYAFKLWTSTAVACGPGNRCCNSAGTDLYLLPAPAQSLGAQWLLIHPGSSQTTFCQGNECQQTCAPFLPQDGAAYELSAMVQSHVLDPCAFPGAPKESTCPQPLNYSLTDLDVAASSLLVGEGDLSTLSRAPIESGHFPWQIPW